MTTAPNIPSGACIVSLGSVNADFQVRVSRRPEISETLMATEFKRLGGGKAANIAFIAKMLGVDTRLCAHIGDDDLAEHAIAPLRKAGIDLSSVRKITGCSTAVSMITVPPDGKKGIVLAANANMVWNDQDAGDVAQVIRRAAEGSVVVVDCEVPAFVVEHALRTARECNLVTVLDPSPADQVTDAMLVLSDYVLPNAGEARTLTGLDCKDAGTAQLAAKRLQDRGAGIVCIKLADGGCVAVARDQWAHIPPVAVEVVDTSGAGDAFAGALAVALLEQRSWPDAATGAVAASHIAVTAYGSQPSYPERDRLETMAQRLSVSLNAQR
jgi:ribokinase